MFFNGGHVAKKRVNLSSNKRETTEDLCKRIKKERAERRQHQEETHAALTIQTMFRKRLAIAQTRGKVAASLDASLRGIPQGAVLPLSTMRVLLAQYNFLSRTSTEPDFDVQRGVKIALLAAASIRAGSSGSELMRAISASPAAVRPLNECSVDGMFEFFQTARFCSTLLGLLNSKVIFAERFVPLAKLVLWVVEALMNPTIVGNVVLAGNFRVAILGALKGKLFSRVISKYVTNSQQMGNWPVIQPVTNILREFESTDGSITAFTVPFIFDLAILCDKTVIENLGIDLNAHIIKLLKHGSHAEIASRLNRRNCKTFVGLIMGSKCDITDNLSVEIGQLLTFLLAPEKPLVSPLSVLRGLLQGRSPITRERLFTYLSGSAPSQESVLEALLGASIKIVAHEDSENAEDETAGSNTSCGPAGSNDSTMLSTIILSEFVGHPSIFAMVWYKYLLRKYSLSKHSMVSEAFLRTNGMRLLLLWTRAAEVRVASMSDTEFYDDSTRVLRDSNLKDAISILSHIAWSLLNNYSINRPAPASSTHDISKLQQKWRECTLLKHSIIRLLQTLYNKNCHKRFCDDDAWEVPAARLLGGPDSINSSVIQEVPFMLPFAIRAGILQSTIAKNRGSEWDALNLYIVRSNATEDTRAAFLENSKTGALRRYLRVEFAGEEGVDGGGLRKELLGLVALDIFGPDRGLFVPTGSDRCLYPSPDLDAINARRLDDYRFAGMLIGACIANEVLIGIPFAQFFLERMREVDDDDSSNMASLLSSPQGCADPDARMSAVSELAALDPEFANNLLSIRSMSPEDLESLELDFTISSVSKSTGRVRSFDLVPGGASIPVTAENRLAYIAAVAHFRLKVEIFMQSKAFFSGLECVIPRGCLRMFSPDELQRLVSGARGPIDIEDWKKNTTYSNGYTEDSPSVVWFWEVVEQFSPEDQAALLHFCTSCPRPPLLGFARLKPGFAIQKDRAGGNRLPSASTCFNLLHLPEVETREQMKRNLEIVIQYPTGFQFG